MTNRPMKLSLTLLLVPGVLFLAATWVGLVDAVHDEIPQAALDM